MKEQIQKKIRESLDEGRTFFGVKGPTAKKMAKQRGLEHSSHNVYVDKSGKKFVFDGGNFYDYEKYEYRKKNKDKIEKKTNDIARTINGFLDRVLDNDVSGKEMTSKLYYAVEYIKQGNKNPIQFKEFLQDNYKGQENFDSFWNDKIKHYLDKIYQLHND